MPTVTVPKFVANVTFRSRWLLLSMTPALAVVAVRIGNDRRFETPSQFRQFRSGALHTYVRSSSGIGAQPVLLKRLLRSVALQAPPPPATEQ